VVRVLRSDEGVPGGEAGRGSPAWHALDGTQQAVDPAEQTIDPAEQVADAVPHILRTVRRALDAAARQHVSDRSGRSGPVHRLRLRLRLADRDADDGLTDDDLTDVQLFVVG
jgi:hypothetical protein